MMTFFVLLQFVLLLFMLFHDWIPVPPLNNIAALKRVDSNRVTPTFINGITVLIPLSLTLFYYPSIPLYAAIIITAFYLLITVGTLLSWWVPYFFDSSQEHKKRFSKFEDTHHFLPPRGDHVVPNTLHVILHVEVWLCLIISIYFLTKAI